MAVKYTDLGLQLDIFLDIYVCLRFLDSHISFTVMTAPNHLKSLYPIKFTRIIWLNIQGIFNSQFYYQLRIDTNGEIWTNNSVFNRCIVRHMSSKVSVFLRFFFSLSSFLAKNPYPPCEDINGNSREVNLKIEDFMESCPSGGNPRDNRKDPKLILPQHFFKDIGHCTIGCTSSPLGL